MLHLAHKNSSISERENDLAIAPFIWMEEKSVGFLFILPLKSAEWHTHTNTHTRWASAKTHIVQWLCSCCKRVSCLQQPQATAYSKDVLYLKNEVSFFQQWNFQMLTMLNKNFSKTYFMIIIHYPDFLNWIYWPACKLSLRSQVPVITLWMTALSLHSYVCVSSPFLGSSCFFCCYCTCLEKQSLRLSSCNKIRAIGLSRTNSLLEKSEAYLKRWRETVGDRFSSRCLIDYGLVSWVKELNRIWMANKNQ